MKCLHICNDFLGSKVHESLYDSLDKLKLKQTIFYPVRKNNNEKPKSADHDSKIEIIASDPIKEYHKYFFRKKIDHLYHDIQSKTNLRKYDIIHATTLFVDGAIALRIHNKYNIPYIVAIRGTDIKLYLKYRLDLFPLARRILYNASKIIFISDSLESNFFNHYYIRKLNKTIYEKSEIIYNGFDPIWLQNVQTKKSLSPYKILYIGRFDKNKNILSLVKSILSLREIYPTLQITLVGKKGSEEEDIKAIAKENPEVINFIGPVYDKVRLKEIYATNHIFAMPSFSESFGLVYLEALSQGLPILYSKGQGIDGVFKDQIGESVDPKSIENISLGLRSLIDNYFDYKTENINFSTFDWLKISQKYYRLYNLIIKN